MKGILILIVSNIYFLNLYSQNHDTIFITDKPINLKELNSEYDDYNSQIISSPIFMIHRLIFSTNRYSKGNDFDLINYRFDLLPIEISDNEYNITYKISKDSMLNDINSINTSCNEFGPYYKKFNPTHYGRGIDSTLFFITRDCDKDLNIYYAKYIYDTFLATHKRVGDYNSLDFINTSFDEGYISVSMDYKNIYYCSNKDGDFDIYSVSDSLDGDAYEIIAGKSNHQTKSLSIINSDFDEKCPFIHWNDWLVFCSNREGGYGRYDLYYSVRKDNIWSTPTNFGDKINTKYDEFRPIILEGRFMIFSSNRPSGLGGFDLYIVEINW